MDPTQRRNGPIQRQDACVSDLPMPLIADDDIYEYVEENQYESILNGLIIPPTESQPKPPCPPRGQGAGGPGDTDRPNTRPHRPPPPPPPPRPRLPSAPPPPVPQRINVPLGKIKKQSSVEYTAPPQKLNRSRTEVDNHDPWAIKVTDTPEGSTGARPWPLLVQQLPSERVHDK
ncbi:hypothetical protein OYC64_009492 [Pagothenia borchgrevinki]|uniref:Uncharacterized protein n=1 Tax=Pagothenia borchgrevinki TaxID=8213 RepID=A0ABD2H7P3_PAGBO